MLREFFIELFDQSIDITEIKKRFLDTTNSTIKYDAVFSSNELKLNIAFRIVWEKLFNILPTKIDFLRFLVDSNNNASTNLLLVSETIVSYCSKNTIYKHIQIQNKDSFLESCRSAVQVAISSPKLIYVHLLTKLHDRFGLITLLNPDVETPLYSIYSELLRSYKNIIRQYSTFLKVPLSEKDIQNQDIYSLTGILSTARQLKQRNVINNALNKSLESSQSQWDSIEDAVCLDELIRYVINADLHFVRVLMGSTTAFIQQNCFKPEVARALNNASTSSLNFFLEDQNDLEKLSDALNDSYYNAYVATQSIMLNFPRMCGQFISICNDQNMILPGLAREQYGNRILFEKYDLLKSLVPRVISTYDHALCMVPCDNIVLPTFKQNIQQTYIYTYCIPTPKPDDESFSLKNVLSSQEFFDHALKTSMNSRCPFRSLASGGYHPRMNYLYIIHALYVNACMPHLSFSLPVEPKPTRDCVLLIDTRASIMSVICTLLTLANLDANKWNVVIVTCPKQKEFYNRFLGTGRIIIKHHAQIREKKFSVEHYSALLKTKDFWDLVQNYEKCLLVQDDATFVKPAQNLIDEVYRQYDYVGAPWARVQENAALETYGNSEFVGNGGFSLRTVKVMQDICEKQRHNINNIFHTGIQSDPEDVFFSHYVVKDGYKICPERLAGSFASEEVLNHNSLGIHKLWMYNIITNIYAFMEQLQKGK